MLRAWLEALGQRRPRGYRPGQTLARLKRDLAGLACREDGAARLACSLPQGGEVDVVEVADALFLSHTVACEFRLDSPAGAGAPAHIVVHHTGALHRTGCRFTVKAGDGAELAPLLGRLRGDAALSAALLPLDFKRCELRRDERGWRVSIEHFGASAVVSRLPAMQRYIRLTPAQRDALIESLAAFRRLLA